MGNDLYLNMEYDIIEDTYKIDTNIKTHLAKDVVSEFLRTQIGAGRDLSKMKEDDKYNISIKLNLNMDDFTCIDNCGNKGLRDGILLNYIKTQ